MYVYDFSVSVFFFFRYPWFSFGNYSSFIFLFPILYIYIYIHMYIPIFTNITHLISRHRGQRWLIVVLVRVIIYMANVFPSARATSIS